MSSVDFNQEARDQGCLHVAVKSVGEKNKALVRAVSKVLHNMPPVQLPEPKGTVLFLRFIDGDMLPCWAASKARWEQYSAHKNVLGLLCVAQCHDADDVVNIRLGYKEICKTLQPGLCGSKCLMYGPEKACTDMKHGMIRIGSTVDELDILSEDINPPAVEKVATELAQGIFFTLRSRMESVQKVVGDPGRTDPIKHLKAPMEKEMERRDEEVEQRQLSRSHLLGRLQKQLADLYLLIGQLQKAEQWYRAASEELRHQKDWLWVGGAFEGLSVTAMMTKECEQVLGKKAQGVEAPSARSILKGLGNKSSPRALTAGVGGVGGGAGSSNSLRYTSSMDPRRSKGGGAMVLTNISRTGRSATVKRNAKSPSPPPLELDQQPEDERQGSNGLVIPNRNDVSNFMEDEEEEGEELDMEGLKKEEDDSLSLLIDSRLLHKDFIVDKFSLALVYFRKAGRLGSIPQMEALLKFSKYLVDQKHFGKAADVLQKMLKVEGISPRDQLSLYQTMASIYHSIGFHRKAAMFTLYAARHANKLAGELPEEPKLAKPNQMQLIHKAHELLVKSLPGFKLSQKLETLPDTMAAHRGWPKLQASVLTDFVYLSTKLGENLIVIKYACYLLEVLHQHMETFDLRKVSTILERVARNAMERCIESPAYASSVAGKLVSPIPLTHFPLVRAFYPRPLIKMMAPHRRAGFKPSLKPSESEVAGKSSEVTSSPFIYSPFAPGKKVDKRKEVLWVEKDPAEMALSISNPLPFELRVENMALMMEGSMVEIFPSSLTLPGGSEQSQFVLVNIPHETGEVTVLGYEATVFGVHYQCSVKIPENPIIRIIPKLPLLQVRSFPASTSAVEEAGEPKQRRASKAGVELVELMDGESCQLQFELVSMGEKDVSSITGSIKTGNEKYCHFSWNQEELASMVPLCRGQSASILVSLHAHLPTGFRLISDTSAGSTRPALFSGTGGIVPLMTTPPTGTPSGSFGHSITPNSSPVIKRGRMNQSSHGRKASNEGLERREKTGSSLMDSLNLDTPHLDTRSNSSTLPNLDRSSPSNVKTNSLRRHKKPKVGNQKGGGFDIDDVIFGLVDKRASVRSDPGDRERREKSKLRSLKSHMGGSSHTSPTSSVSSIPPVDHTQPISILHHPGDQEANGSSPLFKTGSDSLGKGNQALNRNTGSQGKSAKGRAGINKLNISLPTGPLYKEVVQSPKKSKVVGEFRFQYSGGEGAAEGYYREAEANVSVEVRPCLMFEQFDISNTERSQELFQFSFMMHNVCSSQLKVTCKVDQEGLAESGGTVELIESIDSNFSRKCNFLIRKFNPDHDASDSPAGTRTEIHAIKQYSRKLKEILPIHWKVEGKGEGRCGVLSLDGLCLPVASVAVMKPHPILFSVMLNGSPLSHSGTTHSKSLDVGSLVKVAVKLTNNSMADIPVSFLVLEPYTFSQEGRSIVRNLAGKMLHGGNLVTSVPKLSPGASFEHVLCTTFLREGHFLMDIKIIVPSVTKDRPTQQLAPGPGVNHVTKSPAKKTQAAPPLRKVTPPPPPLQSPPTRESPVPPVSPSLSASPPPILPKSARAIARKFEMMETAARSTVFRPTSPQPMTTSQPQNLPKPKAVSRISSTSDDPSPAGMTTPPLSDAPPPIPTSSRPHIVRSGTLQASSRTTDLRNNRPNSSVAIKPVVLAKPIPISSSSSLKSASATTTSSSLAPSARKGPNTLPLKTQSSVVLLTGQSKYRCLWRDRPHSSVKVTSGPNLSFYVT